MNMETMENLSKPELLAPAGNLSKLKTALHFGADAVYLGGKNFTLRTFADNFTKKELDEAVDVVHSFGKKVYVTVNIFAKNSDFSEMEKYLKFLRNMCVDAVLVSDPGVIYMVKNVAPELTIHLSTQANTTNKYAVRFWMEQGLSRVVLARELSLKEIREIHDFVPEIELEAFVHGAMCISYSGRCLLSDYLDGRESNRGACVQACRWKYVLRRISSEGSAREVEITEDDKGSYLMNSKDLNMIRYLKEMRESGICSFKIEGRMKSEYYLATVVNAYRRAIDNGVEETLVRELYNTAHRDYTTAYMLGENNETVNYNNTQEKGDCDYIANVCGEREGLAIVEMRNRFKKGDVLQILSADDNFGKTFTVAEFYNSKGELCDDGKLVQELYAIRCPYSLKRGDILRRRRDNLL